MKSIRKHSFILLLLTIGILFFVLKDNFSEIVSVLLQMNIWYILVSILLIILYWLFKTISKYFIVKEYSEKIKFKTILKQTIITITITHHTGFVSQYVPSELGPFQKLHSIHFPFSILVHSEIIDNPIHFPSFNTLSSVHDEQESLLEHVLQFESHG